VSEFATQKLIDKTRDFRFIAEDLIELTCLKHECSHGALSNYRSCGRFFSQESDLANEVAFFQVRDLTASDRDPNAACANEEKFSERLILFGQRRAPGDFA
jgi:hypothetical protein